jgi:hypothetical protein
MSVMSGIYAESLYTHILFDTYFMPRVFAASLTETKMEICMIMKFKIGQDVRSGLSWPSAGIVLGTCEKRSVPPGSTEQGFPTTFLVLLTVMGCCFTKRPMHYGHFLIYCAPPSEF